MRRRTLRRVQAVGRRPAARAGPVPRPPTPRRPTILRRKSRLRRRRPATRQRLIPAVPAPRPITIRTKPLRPPPQRRTHPPHITATGTDTNATQIEAAKHQNGSFSLLEHVSITNPGPSTNYVSGSATLVSAIFPGGLPSTLTNPAFLSSLLTIAPDGTIGFDRSNFAFLGAGQSLTYAIAFDVQSGSDTIHLTLTLTVNGANEAPTITIGAADAAAATVTDDTHATDLVTHGTLSFKDPDAADAHSVSIAV